MSLKQLFPFLFGFLFLFSCSQKSGRPVNEAVSAFMNGNGNVVSFGSVDLQGILDKAEYKSIPKIGKLIEERLGNVLNTKSSIYYVTEGPFDRNGNPAATYAFFDLKNQDSLVELLGSSGLFLEEAGDMKYTVNGDASIGVSGNLAILITKKEEYKGKDLLEAAFKKTKGDVSGGKTDQLLAKKRDINLNVNLQNLYGGSNTDLAKLDEARKKELKAMMDGSYVHAGIDFEKGKMVFSSENLFSDALEKRMFFQKDADASIVSKLGKGKACVGLATNLDMNKIESLMNDFAPEAKARMLEKILGTGMETTLISMVLGDSPLAKVLNGMAGIVVVGDPRMTGFTPDANFTLGLGHEGKPYISAAAAAKLGKKFNYVVTDTDLIASTPNAGAGMNSLTIPAIAKDFGREGITAFVDLEGMDLKSFGLPMKYKSIGIIQNITFRMDNKGSEFVINAIDPNKNILKQLIDLYLLDIQQQVSNVAI